MTDMLFTPGRLQDSGMLETMLREGEAELVALGRALLADPYWPAKVRRGDAAAVRSCTACNQCLRRLFGPEPINCSVNVACDVAESLDETCASATFLCPVGERQLAFETESVTRRALLAALQQRGIPIIFEARLTAIRGGQVEYRHRDGVHGTLPAARVFLGFGAEAAEAGAEAWAGAAPVVVSVGNCLTPGGVLGAIHGAAEAARAL